MHAAGANESLEYELTFLAARVPPQIESMTPVQMDDYYFPEDPAIHAKLRVRSRGRNYEVTKKTSIVDGDGSAHLENTIPLSPDEFESLIANRRRHVCKDRYRVTISGYEAEVDVFRGRLAGLVLIDFEFASHDEMAAFRPPAECLIDVTQHEFLAGGVLSATSYAEIEPKLSGLGYRRLTAATPGLSDNA